MAFTQGLIVFLAAAFGVFVILLLVGRQQQKELNGSIARLLGASAVSALFTAAPLAGWLVLETLHVIDERQWLVLGIGSAVCLAIQARLFGPPLVVRGYKRPQPFLLDEVLATRVAELSRGLGIRPPPIRLLGSVGASLDAFAWVGCLPAPSIIVTDGLLHRLEPAERDAVLAHELAHLATGSFWLYAAVPAICATAAVLVSALVPASVAGALGIAIYVGLWRLANWPIELACDYRAGRIVGFESMARSLDKVHAAHPVRAESMLGYLTYATATHPHPAVRLAALQYRANQASGRADAPPELSWFGSHRFGSVVATLLWGAIVAGSVYAGRDPAMGPVVTAALLAVSLAPLLLMVSARARELIRARQRIGRDWSTILTWVSILMILISFAANWLHIGGDSWPIILLSGLLLLIASLAITRRRRRLRTEVEMALRERDPKRALELGRLQPKRVRRDPVLRHNLALAAWLAGDRAAGLTEMRQLVLDAPRFKIARLNLSALLLESDPAGALEVAEGAAIVLPRDPGPPALAARALRRLSRPNDAAKQIERALELDPESGVLCAVAATIAIDSGDIEKARRLVQEAERKSPGDAFVHVARAEMALRTDTIASAQALVEVAATAIRASPFAMLEPEVHSLRARLESMQNATGL